MKIGDKVTLTGSIIEVDANSCVVSFPNCEPNHRQVLFLLENKPVDVIAEIEERIFTLRIELSNVLNTKDDIIIYEHRINEALKILKILKGETE